MSNLHTPQAVAARFGVTLGTLAAWRRNGSGPAYIKLGNSDRAKVRYRQADIDAYLEGRLATQTSDVRARVLGGDRATQTGAHR